MWWLHRFSFDDNVSRRVTSTFGWPLSPKQTEVYLSSAGDSATGTVPLDFAVAMGNPHQIWDVLLLIEERATSDADILTLQQNLESKLLPALQDKNKYPELRFGIGGFTDATKSVRILQDLTSVGSNNLWVFQRALSGLKASNAGAGQLRALYSITSPGVKPSKASFLKNLFRCE